MSSRYILRKLMHALVTILAIVILNFVLFRLMPGSPERQTRNPNLRPEVIAANRERWGLDKPHPRAARPVPQVDADRATSATRSSTAASRWREVVLNAAGPTVLLIGARRRRSRSSSACGSARRSGWRRGGVGRPGRATALSLIFYSMPYFVIGMPLIIIFAAGLGWFPTSA